MSTQTINEGLRQHATAKQWEAYCAYCNGGSYGKAARYITDTTGVRISKAAVHEQVRRLLTKGGSNVEQR